MALAACAGPSPGGGGGRKVVLDTAADDAEVGAQASRAVEAQDGVVRDPALSAYLQQLGEKLVRYAPATPFRYQFQIVDQWSPNAFALPGGHIFVSRGLLVLTNTEDELACVLGHEIIHAAERHAASRQAYTEALSAFSLGLPRQIQMAAYARDQERMADTGGQRICSAAGYDPRGLGVFLGSLDAILRLQMGSSRIPTFRDTHPGASERIGSSSLFAATLPPPPPRDPVAWRESYLQRFEGLVLGSDPREGVIQGTRFLHADMGFAIAFPQGWHVVNTPSAVLAISPKHDARFALEDAGRGDDPKAVAEADIAKRLKQVRATIDFQGEQKTRCCKAYVVRGSIESAKGTIAGQLAWVALGGRVFELSSAYVPIAREKYADRARQFVRSFHPLSDEERAQVQIDKLHVVRAQGGETWAALNARTGNVYPVHTTALVNGLDVGAVLSEGELLKIGVRSVYVPEQ
ncbi:MAG TPA: M48 family metalloprotease [Casimicrobiaceae bacterium]|nr:M48 family metalloprotease [Casimicrobiaceae bacterium]